MNKIAPGNRKIFFGILNAMLVIAIALVNFVPILWALLTSLKTEQDIYSYPVKIFNFQPVIENYIYVLKTRFPASWLRSIMYAIAAIIVCIVLSSMAGYAFSRFKNKLMTLLFALVIFGIPLAVGSSALIVPNYIVFSKFGLVNKIFTLPLVYITYNLPMAIWITLGGIKSIPAEIEEAAIIDGCRQSYIIFNLMPSLNKPALASAALFVFIGAWNEFIVSAVLITSPQFRSIQVAVYEFLGYFGRQWGPLMASTILALVPIIVLFSFLGKQLISGLTAGAIKG
jgi:ABC-type glycerol-3-phosphate transport system permease component